MLRLITALWLLLAASTFAFVLAADDDAKSVVARLPYDRDVPTAASHKEDVESALVALGEPAMDALEREMHLELRGGDEQAFTDSGKSKRYCVIRVLGRIDTERSTRVLVETVRAYGDFAGLCDAVVRALDQRALSEAQTQRLVRSACPSAVVFALRKAGTISADSPLRAAAQNVFNHELARQQFRNVYGYPIGNEETLWNVHLAAGRALGIDMVPDMRRRAYALVGDLDAAAHGDLDGAGPPVKVIAAPQAEIDIAEAIPRLVALSATVRDVVDNARKTAQGDFAVILDVALFAMGDTDRLDMVAAAVTDSPHPAIDIAPIRERLVRDLGIAGG